MINWDQLDNFEFMKKQFFAASPFEWLHIDGFLLSGYCEQLNDFSSVTGNKDAYLDSRRKSVQHKVKGMPKTPLQRQLFEELHSEKFLSFLKNITGIDPLYADEALYGGGFHETHDKGYLKIHTDFNILPSTQKHRALNLMIYLNPVWKQEWGGCLELWNSSLDEKPHTILPLMNRMILFRCSEISFHGHPVPMSLPEGVTRKSLAVYYYEDWPKGLKQRPNTHYVNVPMDAHHDS